MRISVAPPPPCIECGSDPINHRLQYWVLALGSIGTPFFLAMQKVGGAVVRRRNTTRLGSGRIYDLLARLKLGEYYDKPDDKTLLLDQVLWEEAGRRGIRMREFRFLALPVASFVATFPSGRRISFESIPFPPGLESGVWWIDTKPVVKREFARRGIPTARGAAAYTLGGALKIFGSLEKPVITKPYEGSGSRHTTIHISGEAELERAYNVAKQVSPSVIVEEELVGDVYRPTLINGKLAATIRRDKPRVVGDGTRTVKELIAEANKHPARGGPYFSKIELTPVGYKELELQHLTADSIPPAGLVVNLHQKINWSVGGTTTDVTDEVHPDNKALFEEIAKVLHAPIVGIDFIIEDISRSWKEQKKCGVIECNGRPFFDNHHLPFKGKPRNVAGAIWDLFGEEAGKTA